MDWNICQNCQMSFRNMELLDLHSCVEFKQEMSEFDENNSGDPLYVNENKTDIKVEGGKDQLASIIEMVHEHNLKVQDEKNLHDENTVEQEDTNQLNKNTKEVYEGMKEMVKKGDYIPANEDYCDICEKPFSKFYLKVHMLKKHQIKTFSLSKDQKDPNGDTENVCDRKNQMVKKSKTVHEEENMCPKCDTNFRTVRRLRIHIEEVHEKKIETVEVPRAKRRKVEKTQLVILPPEPNETFSKEKLFEYLYHTKKIRPGNTKYKQHVKDTVLNFKNITMDKLSESSLEILDKKAKCFVTEIRRKWNNKSKKGIDGFHRVFKEPTFMWTPELKEGNQEKEGKNKQLSDEFLTSIIKQVNDSCKNICDNDTDLERIEDVSQNLKNVLNCYQKILSDRQDNL